MVKHLDQTLVIPQSWDRYLLDRRLCAPTDLSDSFTYGARAEGKGVADALITIPNHTVTEAVYVSNPNTKEVSKPYGHELTFSSRIRALIVLGTCSDIFAMGFGS